MKKIPYHLFFKDLANEARLEILLALSAKKLTVGGICSETGFEQTAVSHELKLLYSCGLAHFERQGKNKLYWAEKDTLKPLLLLVEKHLGRHMKRLVECGIMKM